MRGGAGLRRYGTRRFYLPSTLLQPTARVAAAGDALGVCHVAGLRDWAVLVWSYVCNMYAVRFRMLEHVCAYVHGYTHEYCICSGSLSTGLVAGMQGYLDVSRTAVHDIGLDGLVAAVGGRVYARGCTVSTCGEAAWFREIECCVGSCACVVCVIRSWCWRSDGGAE